MPDREPKLRSSKYRSGQEKNLGKGNIYTSKTPLNEPHCEKCQRLIDRAFGKEDVDSIMGQQYFSHGVNIEETRREIDKAEMARIKYEQEKNIPIPDDRIHFGAFKRELLQEDNTMEADDLIMNDSIIKTIDRKEKKAQIEKAKAAEPMEDLSLIPRALNVHMNTKYDGKIPEKMENVHETEALKADIDTQIDTASDINPNSNELYKQNVYQRTNLDVSLPLKDTANKFSQGSWDDWGAEHNVTTTVQAIVNKKVEDAIDVTSSVLTADIGGCTLDSSLKIDPDETLTLKDTAYRPKIDNYTLEQEINENKLNWNKLNPLKPDHNVHATTAKDDEEQLTQKVEHIDEAPLVEAQKPKLEGFNVTPRVLGDMGQTLNCYSEKGVGNQKPGASSGLDVPARFDEVAKRCLDTPPNKIDEILLKEMEKLGVPITSNRDNNSRSPVIEDELVQMDVLKKQQRRPVDVDKKELDLESHEFERGAAQLCKKDKLYASSYMFNETILPDHKIQSVKGDKREQINASEPVLRIHPHQVLIDPYDKKTLAYDTGEYDPNEKFPSHEFSYFYIPGAKPGQELDRKQIKATLPIEKTKMSTIDAVWNTEQSNPKTEQRRKRESDVTRRRGNLETKLDDKIEHPLAKRIDEAYLQSNKKKVSKPNHTVSEEIEHIETQPHKTITKGDDTNHAHSSAKLSATDATSQENQTEQPAEQTQYTYAKENESTSSYDQTKMYGSYNMWNPQQYHQSQTQQMQQNYAGHKQTQFQQPHLCVSNGTWCQNQYEPQQQANTQNANTQYAFTKESDTTYSYNKINMCVSDDIWDTEQINCEQALNETQKKYARNDVTASSVQSTIMSTSDGPQEAKQTNSTPATKQAQTSLNARRIKAYKTASDKAKKTVTDTMWTKEQLDPKHVLTCNETCPISPRPNVNATETSRIVDTEAIFEKKLIQDSSLRIGNATIHEVDSGVAKEPGKRASRGTKMSKVSKIMQADSLLNPLIKEEQSGPCPTATANITASIPTTVSPQPNEKENVSLSELLKRVRNRSRIVQCQSELKPLGVEVDPTEGKCGNKAPHCPPMAPRSPPNNPVPPPTFGLPKLKPRPRACPKRKPKTKCTSCDLDLSSGLQLGPKAFQRKNASTEADAIRTRSMADLTDEVIDRLQTLGKFLGKVCNQGKSEDYDISALLINKRGSKILLARDYEPWAPIPSWPTSKKGQQDCHKKSRICTPGCKIFPPTRATHDPRCEPRPCTGFPKRTFSLLDCFSLSLGEHKVYDLGEF